MKRTLTQTRLLRRLLFPAAIALGAAGLLLGSGPSASQDKAKVNRYIGADKCKTCHSSPDTGDQFAAWQHHKHAKAFESLASPEAKEAGKARGIEDPQTAAGCLRCHSTAFELPEEQIKKGFDPKAGVQCESCHGPGEAHMKARVAAAAKGVEGAVEIPAGEIVNVPPAETCRGCHNSESPTYKPFCYHHRLEETRHLNPKKHTAEELAKILVCGCGDACACDTECSEACAVPKSDRK